MLRVLAVLTGGTITSAIGEGGAAPSEKTAQRLEELLKSFYKDHHVEITIKEPWGMPGYDSSDLIPLHWIDLTRMVVEETQKGDLRGVIILHGTDTMAYTSAWLSIALKGIPIPVILTGSQLTLDYTPEDVMVNLRGAAHIACTEKAGVWIYFNWKLIPGDRAHKARATHPDAFIAQNGNTLGFHPEKLSFPEGPVEAASWHPSTELFPLLWEKNPFGVWKANCEKMGCFFCFPGVRPLFSGKERLILLFGFGSGNAPGNVLERVVETWGTNHAKPCVVGGSQAEGDAKKLDTYGDVGIAFLKKWGFPLWSQGEASQEFICALGWYALLTAPKEPEKILDRYLEKV